MRIGSKLAMAALLVSISLSSAWAQFGKNKITYETFDWLVYESPHFNVYYYAEEEIFLEERLRETGFRHNAVFIAIALSFTGSCSPSRFPNSSTS